MAIYLIKKLATTNADNNTGVNKHLHVFLAREWTAFGKMSTFAYDDRYQLLSFH